MNEGKIRVFLEANGLHFREMRLKAKITQLKAAKMVGISQAIISHLECGYMLPPPHIIDSLQSIYCSQIEAKKEGTKNEKIF